MTFEELKERFEKKKDTRGSVEGEPHNFDKFRINKAVIAHQLCYGEEVEDKILSAKTVYEVYRIMIDARKKGKVIY